MFIEIESVDIVKADYTGYEYIIVNNEYYMPLTCAGYDQIANADVVKCAPKTSAQGYKYLNPIAYYEDNTLQPIQS